MSFFATKIADEEWGDYFALTPAGYTVLIVLMLAFLLMACAFTKKSRKVKTKALVFSAMAIALAMVTSMLKLLHLPFGGSITLFSMVFICLIGYWYGLRTGLMAAVAYGFLQLIVDPYIISLPQMLMDYIFAFGSLGLSGLFSQSRHGLIKGYLLGITGRFFCSFLSGVIFFGSYAAAYNMAAPIYSFLYNASYIYMEGFLTILLLSVPVVSKSLGNVKVLAMAE